MKVQEKSLPSPRAFDQCLISDFCVTRALIVHLWGRRGARVQGTFVSTRLAPPPQVGWPKKHETHLFW